MVELIPEKKCRRRWISSGITATNNGMPIGNETILAEIEWNTPDMPARVSVNNLTTAKGITLGE
jgi:hypothetical protein